LSSAPKAREEGKPGGDSERCDVDQLDNPNNPNKASAAMWISWMCGYCRILCIYGLSLLGRNQYNG
jgi:hypothetical protein